jgi:hypothetical protein
MIRCHKPFEIAYCDITTTCLLRTARTLLIHYSATMNDFPSLSANASDLENSQVSARALSTLSNLLNDLDASDPIEAHVLADRKVQQQITFSHQTSGTLDLAKTPSELPSASPIMPPVCIELAQTAPIIYSPVSIFDAQDTLETFLALPPPDKLHEKASTFQLKIVFSTDNGLLSLGSTIANEISIHGSIRVLNAALKGLQFVPNASFFGLATLTISASEIISADANVAGNPASFQATQKVLINAAPLVIHGEKNTKGGSRVIQVTGAMLVGSGVHSDFDANLRDVYTLLSNSNAASLGKVHRQGIEIRGGDSFCQQDIDLGFISYTPSNNATASSPLSFDVTDRFGGALPTVSLNAHSNEQVREKSHSQPAKLSFDKLSRNLFTVSPSANAPKTITKHHLRLTVQGESGSSVSQTYELMIASAGERRAADKSNLPLIAPIDSPTQIQTDGSASAEKKPSLAQQIGLLTEQLEKKSLDSASITLELLSNSSIAPKRSKIVGESVDQLLANWTKTSRITQSVTNSVAVAQDVKIGEFVIPLGLLTWLAQIGRLLDAFVESETPNVSSSFTGNPTCREKREHSMDVVSG